MQQTVRRQDQIILQGHFGVQSVIKGHARRIFFAAIAAFLIILPVRITAHAASITSMSISNTEENLILSLRVEGAFTDQMKEAILSGISTSFSYVVTLTQTRTVFPDKYIHESKFTNTVKYDTLRKSFVVRRSWENYRPMTTSSFAEARMWMSEINSVPVIPLESLKKDNRYRINAKVELDKITLPFFLNYIFFFTSLWDFETSWYSIDFVY
jgi:hypothetical protein